MRTIQVTEGWLRTVFTANNGDALGTIVAALRKLGRGAEDSEESPLGCVAILLCGVSGGGLTM